MKFSNMLQNWKLKRKKVKQMIKIGLALIGVVVFVGLYACVVAGKNADNAMHDYFEKYK
jgi:lipopolysaccharide/colanic/teichoic acid biosynthesis glycosyltransferase